jgi:uncharacterized protein (DUF1501 family)
MTDQTRRQFLIRSTALGCSLAASPFVTPVTLAAAPWDARLVVIILRGAMDGLDVVQPYGDPHFAGYRPNLPGGEAGGGMDLDGFYSMSAHLGDLKPMWRAGELAFAQAVATPYRDKRSHFDGQDLLEAGTGMDVGVGAVRDGWLNRMLAEVPGVTARTAFAVGREDLIILNGAAPVSSWSPDTRLDLSPQGRRLLEALYHDDPVFNEAANLATEMVDLLHMAAEAPAGEDEGMGAEMETAMLQANRAGRAAALAGFTADRLAEETRIAAFSIGGWDTHRTQANAIKGSLGELSSALLTLKDRLGGTWSKTVVLAMTEFGRTVRENGSRGTDHGTGGAMVLAGGAIRGGRVFGDWPGLGESDLYQNRDLRPTADVRAYAGHAMRGLFGLEAGLVERVVFPGLDLGRDPGILL